MKRNIFRTIFVLILFLLAPAVADTGNGIRNIILMIPDGLSIEGTTLVRWMNEGKPLAWDPYVCGLVRTHAADAPITDSAPAATAFSTGHKSHTGFVGILPDEATMPGLSPVTQERVRAPLMTILEASGLLGKSTGIVATSEVTHATPAAFSSHIHNRGLMNDIARQMVHNGLDVVLGGGGDFFDPRKRPDKEDLWALLKRFDVTVVRTPADMMAHSNGRLWGIFDSRALTCDKTRDPLLEPSLAEMTDKAIEQLSLNEKGFFLMVEGSQIDWAGHGNDPVAYVADSLAFNRAVERALSFAKEDGRTVVIVVADHGTGGISFGAANSNKGYDTRELKAFLDPLKQAKSSAYELEKRILKIQDQGEIERLLRECYALSDISDEELQAVLNYCAPVREGKVKPGKLDRVIGPMLSRRAAIGWTTTGHVGGDVALAVYHPTGDRPMGVVDNTDISRYMQRLFAVDLDALTDRYFIEAKAAFESRGARVVIQSQGNSSSPTMRVRKGGKRLLIPAHSNRVWFNGRELLMPSLTVYNGQQFYVSQEMLKLLDG